jgi:outer membrane protein
MKRFAKGLCRVVPFSVALATILILQTGVSFAEEPDRGTRIQPYAVPEILSLSQAISIGLHGSTTIATQQANLDASITAKRAAWFGLGPDLLLNASKTEQRRTDIESAVFEPWANQGDPPVFVGLDDLHTQNTFRSFGAASSMRLFDGFANWSRVSAAQKDIETDQFNLAYSATTVQTNIVDAYYNLLRAKLLLNVAQEAEDVSREELERTQALYELGSAARSDVLKSQVDLGNQRLIMVQARNSVRQRYDGLVYAMNLFTATPFEIDTTLATIPDETFEFLEEVDYARDHRLDLKALRAAEEAQGSRVTMARGTLFPTLDLSYRYAFDKGPVRFTFGSGNTQTYSWTLSSNWNVFDRYQVYSNISNAKASQRIAEYNRTQTELDAVREIRGYLNQLREARERLAVASENVERSEEDLRLATEKFRVGAGTILERLLATSDLTSTKAEEVQAIVDYLIARANLHRSTGRPLVEL